MLVSVILPTSGRQRSLARTLRSVLRQSLPVHQFEVLVVENGLETGARRVASLASRQNAGAMVRYVHEPTPGLLAGRHRGAFEARGELLVFADDDIDASPAWLQAIVEAFEDRRVDLVGGRNLPRYEVTPPQWVESFWYTPPYGGRACVYLSLLDLGEERHRIDGTYVWGLNFAIRRQTLFELGGFHPDNPPEHLQHFQGDGETGLARKANAAGLGVVYAPAALVFHRIPLERLTVDYFCRRFFRQGVCDSYTAFRDGFDRIPMDWHGPSKSPAQQSLVLAIKNSSAPSGFLARMLARRRRLPRQEVNLSYWDIEPTVRASFQAGFRIHQDLLRENPTLQAWVRREDYWDYRFPDLGICRFAELRERALRPLA